MKHGSYKALTVEFFTTLTVESSGRNINSMSFRLDNEEHTISVDEFNELFHLIEEGEEGILEDPQPEDYNRNEFWSLISSEAVFTPSRAKINSIRNPVLRYMAKALVYYPLAHT